MGDRDEHLDEELEGFLSELDELGQERDPERPPAPKRAAATTHPEGGADDPGDDPGGAEDSSAEPRFRRQRRGPSKGRTRWVAAAVAVAVLLVSIGAVSVLFAPGPTGQSPLPAPGPGGPAVAMVFEPQRLSFAEFLENQERARHGAEAERFPRYRVKTSGEGGPSEGRPEVKEVTRLRLFLDNVASAFKSLFK